VVCHGVPSATEILKNGDIINFDITLEKNGFIADSSKTYLVGDVSPSAQRLVQTAYQAMWKGIQAVRPGPGWEMSGMRSNGMPDYMVIRSSKNIVGMG
jgi:methionyl aminopeptidase